MTAIEILGYVAALFTTICYIPQVWHTYTSKDVSGISLGMYVALAIGIGLWLVYSVILMLGPLIACNGFCFVMIIAMLAMKIRYSKLYPQGASGDATVDMPPVA